MESRLRKALLKWLVFSVVLGLLPLLFSVLNALTYEQVTIIGLLASGALLTTSAGLCGSALGNLAAVGQDWEEHKYIATGTSVIIIALASFYFARVGEQYITGEAPPASTVAIDSVVLYIVSLICGAYCVGLAETAQE